MLRRIDKEDGATLVSLWAQVFGDSEDYIRGFLALLPALGFGLTHEENGRLLSMGYLLRCFTVAGTPLGYLYALAVEPEARGRGFGRELCLALRRESEHEGLGLLATLPAEPGLYPWYAERLGARSCLRRRLLSLPAQPGEAVAELCGAAYAEGREALLAGKAHITLSEAAVRLEELNCRASGGALLRVGEGLAACYPEGEALYVREALGERPERIAAAAAAFFSLPTARLALPDKQGQPYIALTSPLPEETHWALAFD